MAGDDATCPFCGQGFGAEGKKKHQARCNVASTAAVAPSPRKMRKGKATTAATAEAATAEAATAEAATAEAPADATTRRPGAARSLKGRMTFAPVKPTPAADAGKPSRPSKRSRTEDPPPPPKVPRTTRASSGRAREGGASSSNNAAAVDNAAAPAVPTLVVEWEVAEDDFKVEFHPRANKAPEFARFEDFKSKQVEAPVSVPKEPWIPFKSRLDFEFSEFCAEAGLNKRQIDSVLKLVQRAAADPTQLHIKTAAEMSAAWERAKPHQPAFEKTVIEVPYNKSTLEFDVHSRSLWKWALAMIRDPTLAQHIVWDAVKQQLL
ncbi:hypothetical protein OH76DRAFT_1444863 [Lentinus brumalis]|uniref:Uncharacterized protein n=1 Tax=Lentinus brumalis TaxID=2498619 RepID=A0A371CYC6_9APHY|nr:hypothetical protein OH76DRAFT_1444863 [Polyporus brumalis]